MSYTGVRCNICPTYQHRAELTHAKLTHGVLMAYVLDSRQTWTGKPKGSNSGNVP